MSTFEARLTGTEQLQATLQRVMAVARAPSRVMQKLAAVLEDETEQNFAAEGRPKWKGLSEATRFSRVGGSKGYTKKGELRKRSQRVLAEMKILQDTGALAASVHSRSGSDFALIAAATPYARIHQLGGRAGRGRQVMIPARPYLPFTPDFKIQPEAEKALLAKAMAEIGRETGIG
jgi:phage virion morphogenesis protein